MKKSSFVAMVLGTVSVVLFALGMCMALMQGSGGSNPSLSAGKSKTRTTIPASGHLRGFFRFGRDY